MQWTMYSQLIIISKYTTMQSLKELILRYWMADCIYYSAIHQINERVYMKYRFLIIVLLFML